MFFNNYHKAGKGVEKRNPNQPRIQTFFEIFPAKLWKLFKLNLLYVLFALPFLAVVFLISGIVSSSVINACFLKTAEMDVTGYDILIRFIISFLFMGFLGTGPASVGFSYVLREYASEVPCMLIGDFFEQFRLHFKQSFLIWVIDLIALSVFSIAAFFYSQIGFTWLQYIIFAVALVYVMMHNYLYQMMISYHFSLRQLFQNSLLLTLGKLPINLLILVINIVLYLLIPMFIILSVGNLFIIEIVLFFVVFLFPAISGFITSFCVTPVLQTYITFSNHQN